MSAILFCQYRHHWHRSQLPTQVPLTFVGEGPRVSPDCDHTVRRNSSIRPGPRGFRLGNRKPFASDLHRHKHLGSHFSCTRPTLTIEYNLGAPSRARSFLVASAYSCTSRSRPWQRERMPVSLGISSRLRILHCFRVDSIRGCTYSLCSTKLSCI